MKTNALNGHNVVLTGQGGSGKTHVIKILFNELVKRGKNVSITCSTGIAATQYENGQTLHRWCGIGEGGIPKSELSKLIINDERYMQTRERIKTCNVLFIDECSMVSQKMFETVDFLCRSVRADDRYFGGVQIILSGDFYQLPPVPDELYGETGKYCFESKYFFDAVPHRICLETIFRQKDSEFICCVNEIEKGTPSNKTIEYMKHFERDITHSEKTIHLFSTNFKTKLFNHDKLKTIQGPVKLYYSKDEGDLYYLNRFQAPATLGLKIDCPVMLVVNLSESLVNGSTGKVKELCDDHVTVHFNKPDKIVKLSRHLFTKIDPVSRRTLSKRLQFPLVLSFGITIHKSQGMTLESVVVDCENASIPGQIGVALGRVMSPKNLQVKNFKSCMVTEHPLQVKQFYEIESKKLCADLTCCSGVYIPTEIQKDLFTPFDLELEECLLNEEEGDNADNRDDEDDLDSLDGSTDDDDNDDDRGRGKDFAQRQEQDPVDDEDVLLNQRPELLPDYIDHIELLNKTFDEYRGTPMEESVAKMYEEILKNSRPFFTWLGSQFLRINRIADDNFSDVKVSEQKNVTKFCSDVNTFLKSNDYICSCKTFYCKYGDCFEKTGQFVCTSVMFRLQSIIIEKKTELINVSNVTERVVPTEKCEEGKGNTRYIGGYCIGKLKYSYQTKVQRSLYDPKKEVRLKVARSKTSLLSQLTISYSQLAGSTSFSETLKTTARKQNIRQGLTNITDSAFVFFQSLNQKVRKVETFQNLHKYGQDVIANIKSSILNDTELFQIWLDLFKEKGTDLQNDTDDDDAVALIVSYITELFDEIVTQFVKVSASHFRKDYLLHIKREKGKAHRKKIMVKKEAKNVKKVALSEIDTDISDGKLVTHLKLKAGVLGDDQYFNNTFYTKKDLIKLCEEYEIPTLSKHNKQYLNDQLVNVIKQCDVMLTPHVFIKSGSIKDNCEKVPNVSTSDGTSSVCEPEESCCQAAKGKGKGKGKGKRSTTSKSKGKAKRRKDETVADIEESGCCCICYQQFDDSPDWICCDGCNKWLHGHCVGIQTDEQWEKYTDETVQFFCPFCE